MSEKNIMEGITLTGTAADKVRSALKVENKEGYYLRMSVKGGGCSGMTYKMSFDNDEKEFDKIFESQGIKIVCDLQSWMYLKGTNIEYSDDMLNGGFKITNPNAERTCGCGTSFSV
jgi:iron-sulfur cluster assembly protein|tara:strand:+ start:489 stop:836 length:348 start_codon:yes stop_codon:yes gene_type:complete